MDESVISYLEAINDWITQIFYYGDMTNTLEGALPTVYKWCISVGETIMMPVAYVILSLFFVLELYKVSVRQEEFGIGSQFGATIVFKVMIKFVVCKTVLESTVLIMKAIYELTRNMTDRTSDLLSKTRNIQSLDMSSLKSEIEEYGTLELIGPLMITIVVLLMVIGCSIFAKIIVLARFIQIYTFLAIAPIPIATLADDEFSQIGKGFLKSFAAVCLQGLIVFLVLSFFPEVVAGIYEKANNSDTSLLAQLAGAIGYCLVLCVALSQTGKWSKSILNAA